MSFEQIVYFQCHRRDWQQTFANEASQAKIVMQIGVIWVWINLGYVPSVIDHSQHLKPARTHVYSCVSLHFALRHAEYRAEPILLPCE